MKSIMGLQQAIIGLVALLISTVGQPSAANELDGSALLKLICEPRNIQGAKCRDALNFPPDAEDDFREKDTKCSVSIEQIYVISAENRHYVIAPYLTECSGHPDLGGGSLLASLSNDGSLHFLGYWPGKRAGDADDEAFAKECVVVKRSTSDDRLYCLSYYRSTGSAVKWLVSFDVHDGRLSSETSDLRLGRSVLSAGAIDMGVYSVTCDEALSGSVYFDLSHLAPGRSFGGVEFIMTYADAAAVRRACRPDQNWPLNVRGEPMIGVANVPAIELHSGHFAYAPPFVFRISEANYH